MLPPTPLFKETHRIWAIPTSGLGRGWGGGGSGPLDPPPSAAPGQDPLNSPGSPLHSAENLAASMVRCVCVCCLYCSSCFITAVYVRPLVLVAFK